MPKKSNQKPLFLSLVGPPLSGKGTQAEKLAVTLGLPHLVMSQILKEVSAKDKKIGAVVLPLIANGVLVPSEIVEKIQAKYLLQKELRRGGFVIEGAPRRVAEAKYLDSLNKLTAIVVLKVPLSEMIKRAGGRRQCRCGQTYHLTYNPPRRAGFCDACGDKLFIREDDKPKVIKQRMKIYESEMKKISAYFKKTDRYIEVDGVQSIEEVYNEMLRQIIFYLYRH
jgi:adenylate kinase